MQFDVTKIPNLEGRRECARLYKASCDADHALEEAEEKLGGESDQKYVLARQDLWNDYQKKRDALDQDRRTKLMEINKQEAEEQGIAGLKAAAEAAQEAYNEHPDTVCIDDDGDIRFCALSGEPLLEADDVLADYSTGDAVIRTLVLAPISEQPAEDEAA